MAKATPGSRRWSLFEEVDVRGRSAIGWRRVSFLSLVAATMVGLLALMVRALSPGGIGVLDLAVLVLFAGTLPFNVVAFWNAMIGFGMMRLSPDPLAATCPPAAAAAHQSITARTAILVCIRNEEPEPVFARLTAMLEGLAQDGLAPRFDAFVLSDTSCDQTALAEQRAFARLRRDHGSRFGLTYRRRSENPGYKAGNIRDFCLRWGSSYDFALVLDADSYMSAAAIARLVRTMQATPRLGILQSLVVGMPATSAFARVFQFGMRFAMRSHTLGAAWWQGDCGPYWGHNALIRLAPFIEHCELPRLAGDGPLSGWILSHDQLEAALMRRAGYAVRVIPVEDESYEQNPPTLVQFVQRDLRWCAGNMQYVRLLGLPGLPLVSRLQLLLAVLMFTGSAVWMGMVMLFALAGFWSGALRFDATAGLASMIVALLMTFAPKLTSLADVVLSDSAQRHGGLARLVVSFVGETVFSTMLAPVMALSTTIFLAGLVCGRRAGWSGQQRDAHGLGLGLALSRFWPQLLFGGLIFAAIGHSAPRGLPYAAPMLAGLVLAVPFAMLTASPWLGRQLQRLGLFAAPEELEQPAAPRVPCAVLVAPVPAPSVHTLRSAF